MTTEEQPTTSPSCEQTPTGGEDVPPPSDKEPIEGKKRPAKAKRSPPKIAKIECPFCGELISKRYKKCPACRSVLQVSPKKEPVPSTEEKIEDLSTESVAQPILEPAVETPAPEAPIVHLTEASQPTLTAVTAEPAASVESTSIEHSSEKLVQETPAEPPVARTETADPPVLESATVQMQSESNACAASVAEPPVLESPCLEAPMPTPVEENAVGESVSAGLLTEQKTVSDAVASQALEPTASVQLPAAMPDEMCNLAEVSQPSSHGCGAIVLRSSMDTPRWISNLLGISSSSEQTISTPVSPPQGAPQDAPRGSNSEMQTPQRMTRKRKLKSRAPSSQAS